MTREEVGFTIEERVEFFESRFMFKAIVRALFGVYLYNFLSGMLELEFVGSMVFTVVFYLIYLSVITSIYEEEDIHGEYKSFRYKGKYYWLGGYGEGEELERDNITHKLHNIVREKMVKVDYTLLFLGLMFSSFMGDVTYSTIEEYIVYAIITLALLTPIIIIAMVHLNKLLEMFQGTLMASAFGVIYDELVEEGAVQRDGSMGYAEWSFTDERKRKDSYTEQVNTYYSDVDSVIQEKIDEHIRITPTDFIHFNELDEEELKELEDNVNNDLKVKGSDLRIKFVEEQQDEEQQEEYELEELYEEEDLTKEEEDSEKEDES